MKVLLLGSGGRESALAWGLSRSARVTELLAAPGNPGIAQFAETTAADIEDPAAVLELVKRCDSDLVVVGPEAPLVAGVADAVVADGTPVFGPGSAAARIEGSKSHAKDLMERAGIATAGWRAFADADAATSYLDELGPPYVIKADGLAAGKGVVVTDDRREAVAAVRERLVDRRFGEAGSTIVVEEFLDGEETSLIALTDGISVVACEPAQDYKRALDGDAGPNTGGMGSYSPVPACPPALAEEIVASVLEPMVRRLADDGTPFVGALYAGLALTSRGPKVVEFNARFGDPETQALVPRMRSDLADLAMACATGSLSGMRLEWSPDACVTVVAASGGYPGEHRTGLEISGLREAAALDGVALFHSGTKLVDGRVVTAGGRVLAVSAIGSDLATARGRAYEAVNRISFEDMHVRTDIALRAQEKERSL